VLPLHLVIGYALGWSLAARDTRLTVAFGLGGLAALAWGALAALTGDGDRIVALGGATLIAAANVIIGAIVGAAVTTTATSRR
jgi:hypothetical protein